MSPLTFASTFKPNSFLAHTTFAPIHRDSTPLFFRASALFSLFCHAESAANAVESRASTHFPLATEGVAGDGWSARSILHLRGLRNRFFTGHSQLVTHHSQPSKSDELKRASDEDASPERA